jgi:hypothetical protein
MGVRRLIVKEPIMKILLAIGALALSLGAAQAADLPDPALTPGVIDPACTVETLRTTTTTGRRTTTAAMKAEAYRKYGMVPHHGACDGPRGCEVDHRVPLEVCGADDQANLWPMPYAGPCGAGDKDRLENQTKADILAGTISLEEGQRRFLASDWREEYRARFGRGCD